jgi:photosystem II biogenesis protein Psp29
VNNPTTVSDAKRKFYDLHTRPINSIYRRVVEELLVEMHLLSTNVDFVSDPIYILGVVDSFDRFMASYRPETDKVSIFNAICQAVGADAQNYRQIAATVKEFAESMAGSDMVEWIAQPKLEGAGASLATTLGAIAGNAKFKYSRLFGIGLYAAIERATPEVLKQEKDREAAIKKISEALHISTDKLQKDFEAYRNNLDKLVQMEAVMADAIEAERKKRDQREQDKAKASESNS